MKILRSWLEDYVKIPLKNDELALKLDSNGLAVEEITTVVDSNVVVAKIKSVDKHPNADKLNVTIVTDGENDYEVVCGAPNIEADQLVPLAKIGSIVGGQEIKEVDIRGVVSHGMLCSERELGLGEDHTGIKILPATYALGRSLSDFIDNDAVMDLDITANRGDCLSHIGVAREVAAASNKRITKEPVSLKMSDKKTGDNVSVEIKDKKDCPKYFARMLTGVKVAPSPKWLQDRLIACGATPINNIVDITNYILLDLGQPLHAFDAEKVKDGKIIVRRGKSNEKMTTLDGKDYTLTLDNLVIADPNEAIAIAGIMGGFGSQITDSTSSVIIEAALFDPKVTRKSSKVLGLSTDASYRFERGIDSNGIQYAIDKAAKMMKELGGGEILSGIVQAGDEKNENVTVQLEYKKINNLLGTSLSNDEIDTVLRSLEFEINDGSVSVPSFRHDITIWQDLAEEVGRLRGYDNIKPVALPNAKPPKKSPYYFKELIKDMLSLSGFTEVLSYPYTNSEDIEGLEDKDELLMLQNPLQPENKYLRNSLVPGLLKVAAKNSAFDPLLIYEIGHIFKKSAEKNHCAILIAGKSGINIAEIIDQLSSKLNITPSYFKPKTIEDKDLINIKLRKVSAEVVEFDIDDLMERSDIDINKFEVKPIKDKIIYRRLSKYPSVSRDLAFIVKNNIKAEDITAKIYEASVLVSRVELFDEFKSDKFGKDNKSQAFHIFLSAQDKTLTDAEAEEIIKLTIKNITTKFSAKLRDK